MTANIALANIRNQVRRKVGRNVVNFHKMEAMLKVLNTQQALCGTLNDIPGVLAEAKRLNAKSSLGKLATAFIRFMYSNGQGAATLAASQGPALTGTLADVPFVIIIRRA